MSKQTKDKNKNKQEDVPVVNGIGQGMGLLGGMLSSNIQNPESELPPLPSTSGGITIPVTTTTPTPTTAPVAATPAAPQLPSSYSTAQGYGYSRSYDANQEERAKAEAQQLEEEKKANEYNATLTGRINTLNSTVKKPGRRYDDMGKIIPSTYTPMAPLPVIPKEIEVPRMILGTDAYNENKRESSNNRNPSPREKYKTPTIATPDYMKGVVNPLSPSSVFLDIQGGIRAANDAGNPSLGRKATDDNFGTQIIPKGTMAKMPVWMFNKQTGKYDFKGINDVDVGGSSMADVAQRVATSWIAHNLMNDINAGKKFTVKVKDKNGNIVYKQIPLVSNYGQEVGASQLKFAPSVFVQALGGDYNTAIADAYTKTVDSLGLPSGSVTYRPNSVVARRIEDKNSKAHQTWLGAKDNDLTGDTINGWGNSIINGLFGQMFGAK